MRAAIQGSLTFATERWSGSGALFTWDLWNEIHPAHAEDNPAAFHEFISGLSLHPREVKMRRFGRAHPKRYRYLGLC
jgi:hypothetical protein